MMKAMLAAAARSEQNIPQHQQQPAPMERQRSATSIISKLSNSSAATAALGADLEKADKPKQPVALFGKRPSMWNSVHKLLKEKPAAPPKKFENTYRMQPEREHEFKSHQVRELTEEILKIRLNDEKYDQKRANNLARNLAEVIKSRVKKLDMPRHKIVVFCVIGSRQEQCLRLGSRCVWDEKTDDFASASFQNGSIFAVATVYGIYCE